MSQLGDLIGQDETLGNDGDLPGFAAPVSTAEIDDLLYSEDWPVEERLARLQSMREQMAALEPSDFGDDDPAVLIGQIDEAIARLTGGPDTEIEQAGIALDPVAHRETLAPDSDELAELEEEDEASFTDDADAGPIDESEWIDGDGFAPEKGVL